MSKKKQIELREMASGCYVLTEDVQNPKPDRRATRDWTNAETWPKGMRLFVRNIDNDHVKVTSIEGIDDRWTHMNIRRSQHDAERWNAITAKMQCVDEDLDGMLHRLDAGGWSRARILEQLVKDNKVALADIEKAYERAMREDDDDTMAATEEE